MTDRTTEQESCQHLHSEFLALLNPANGMQRERRQCTDCGREFNVQTSIRMELADPPGQVVMLDVAAKPEQSCETQHPSLSFSRERNAARLELANRLESIACNIQAPDEQVTIMARAVAWLREPCFVPEPGEQQALVEIEFLEQWLRYAGTPVGQECCNRPGSECCGSPNPVYLTFDEVLNAMNARRAELISTLRQPETKRGGE